MSVIKLKLYVREERQAAITHQSSFWHSWPFGPKQTTKAWDDDDIRNIHDIIKDVSTILSWEIPHMLSFLSKKYSDLIKIFDFEVPYHKNTTNSIYCSWYKNYQEPNTSHLSYKYLDWLYRMVLIFHQQITLYLSVK